MGLCASQIAIEVRNGTDNVAVFALEGEDGAILSTLAALTRATLTVGAVTVDSDVHGSSVVWWTEQWLHQGQTIDVLKFKIGQAGITAGVYEGCELVTYDAVNTNGVWHKPDLKVTVVD